MYLTNSPRNNDSIIGDGYAELLTNEYVFIKYDQIAGRLKFDHLVIIICVAK